LQAFFILSARVYLQEFIWKSASAMSLVGGKCPIAESHKRAEIAMHFSLTGQYSPQALNSIMDNPTVSRYEAAKNLMEAAGGKLIAMYSTQADGPGVLAIFDVPDPSASAAIAGVVIASGTLTNAKLTRLYTQDEIVPVRKKASQLRGSYKPPGK
jgi:uncharacterized protein with GYD domain